MNFFTIPDLIGKSFCFAVGHDWTMSQGGTWFCSRCNTLRY